MPGTHSDNDHSFIDMLPLAYKKVAYQFLRSDSLQTMLCNLKHQNFSAFQEIKRTDEFAVETINKTLYACVVAKITSFSKDRKSVV